MTRTVYVAAAEGASVKSIVALGLVDLLTRQVGRVGVFRPVTPSPNPQRDEVADLLLAHPAVRQRRGDAIGLTYAQVHADPSGSHAEIVRRFAELRRQFDALVVIGSDYTDLTTPGELSFNAQVAADLGTPVVLVVSGRGRDAEQVGEVADVALAELAAGHARVVAVVANRVNPSDRAAVAARLSLLPGLLVAVIEEVPLLSAPTVGALLDACGARLMRGNPAWLQHESLGFVVAGMSLPNVLTRLRPGCTVITPGDRSDLLPGLLLAHQAGTYGHLSAIVLTGGYLPPEPVQMLIDGLPQDLPVAVSDQDTFPAAQALAGVRGKLTADSPAKVETALRVFAEAVDGPGLLAALEVAPSAVVTPLMFQFRLIEQARAQRKRIVLPESDDDRILQAAASVLRLGVARLTLIGEETTVRARASRLGLDISDAQVVSIDDATLRPRFAAEFARLRARKGVTEQQAYAATGDTSYFATMMVRLGLADGMVSGAIHTTADTLRPAFQIIGMAPGTSVVSSVFLMCLADQVLVYGDCAVIPEPTADQLADIAISAAGTARQFGIEPRIAMLSYSTGASGAGTDVDRVRAAVELVRSRRSELAVEGPIQYDAAVDRTVAAVKAPGSPVAGRATVLIFPDLNTGNNTYKAVQRSAGAVAVGPVLQGLARPVNDLSRGALVDDIVNTIAITAIQAQKRDGATTDVAPNAPGALS